MSVSFTDMKNATIGPVTAEQATEILGARKFREGGGWGKINGQDVYLCIGAHKDGTSGWRINQIGRSF